MSLKLNKYEVCSYSLTCPYNVERQCQGANPSRGTEFVCDLVSNGVFLEGKFRNPLDQTGRMKIIQG